MPADEINTLNDALLDPLAAKKALNWATEVTDEAVLDKVVAALQPAAVIEHTATFTASKHTSQPQLRQASLSHANSNCWRIESNLAHSLATT